MATARAGHMEVPCVNLQLTPTEAATLRTLIDKHIIGEGRRFDLSEIGSTLSSAGVHTIDPDRFGAVGRVSFYPTPPD